MAEPTLARLTLPVSLALQEAIDQFDCVGQDHEGDPIAAEVQEFLVDGEYGEGIRYGYSATYLLLDASPEGGPPELLGYITVSVDSLRLTGGEKKLLGRPSFGDFGAVRIVMIGIDHRHAEQGLGELLIKAIVDLALEASRSVPVRFLVADANIRKQDWYERRGFVVNRSKVENDADDPSPETISMRLDLRAA